CQHRNHRRIHVLRRLLLQARATQEAALVMYKEADKKRTKMAPAAATRQERRKTTSATLQKSSNARKKNLISRSTWAVKSKNIRITT
ncbi:MAG: hypothetical protein D8H97_13260, partial [Neisseria sp.]